MRATLVLAALILTGCAAAPTAPVEPVPAARYTLQAVGHEAAHVVQQRGGVHARVWRGRGRGLQPFTAAWSDATGHLDLRDGEQATERRARRKALRAK